MQSKKLVLTNKEVIKTRLDGEKKDITITSYDLKEKTTIKADDILKLDTYGEEFQILFVKMLEKFVREYDDMAQMEVIKKASELLELINNG